MESRNRNEGTIEQAVKRITKAQVTEELAFLLYQKLREERKGIQPIICEAEVREIVIARNRGAIIGSTATQMLHDPENTAIRELARVRAAAAVENLLGANPKKDRLKEAASTWFQPVDPSKTQGAGQSGLSNH